MNRLSAIALCLGWLASGVSAQGALPSAAPFFAASLPDMHNRSRALSSLLGKPLLVNFWARWCNPCREEISELEIAYRKLNPSLSDFRIFQL